MGPAAFALQEHMERLLHHGEFPWSAVLEPTFALGLLLQLPIALAAWLVAHLLLRVTRAVAGAIARALADFVSRPGTPRRPRCLVHVSLRSRGPALLSVAAGRAPPALSLS
jgi:hypothetical protein